MNFGKQQILRAAVAAVAFALVSSAHAEIDERDIASTVGPAPDTISATTRADDRAQTREALVASDRAAYTRATRGPSQSLAVGALPPVYEGGQPQVGTQVLVQSQSNAEADSSSGAETTSRTEMMRRQRVREEIQNEDALTERLESLRLRDERARTGTITSGWDSAEAHPQGPAYVAPMQTETVTRTTVSNHETVEALTKSSDDYREPEHDNTRIYVQGRGGVAMMSANGEGYDVNSRYSLGVGLGFVVTSNLSVEAGYSFNEYGVSMGYPYGYPTYGNYNYNGNSTGDETIAMKQNVVDLGLKLHVLGVDSRVRPYVSAGAAYAKSYVNFDEKYLQQYNQAYGNTNAYPDYELSQFLGYLGTGLDVRLSRVVSISGNFRYYGVFSSRENQPLNSYPGYYGGGYSSYAANPQVQQAGGSLAGRGFYTLGAGLTFVF